MKKTVIIAAVLIVLTATSSFAIGIGGIFGLPVGDDLAGSNVMLSLKLDDVPFLLGIGFSANGNNFQFGGLLDYHLTAGNLTGPIGYYAGLGGFLGLGTNLFQIGARVPLGLFFYPIEPLELFLELSPAIGVGLGGNGVQFPIFGLQTGFGFRFWF